jgi:hypothetical protein
MEAVVLVIIVHFLTGDLSIMSWTFPDEESCLEAQQDDTVQLPTGAAVITKQCVASTDQET